MMKLLFNSKNACVFSLYILIFLSCNKPAKKPSVIISNNVPDSSQKDTKEYSKADIDSLFNSSREKLIIFVKVNQNETPVMVINEKFPDNVGVTFNILKEKSGRILRVSEYPFSESGDWFIAYSSYYNKNGRIFAFEKKTNFFNSNCTENAAFETVTEFYDSDFNLTNKDYKLVDESGQTLQKDSCVFLYNYKYEVQPNLHDYLKIKRIDILK